MEQRPNGRHFADDNIKMHFPERKPHYFDWDLTNICSQVSNEWKAIIGSQNDVDPKGLQAIVWANIGLFSGA